VRILLDTCVVSEISRPQGNPAVRQRVEDTPNKDLLMSVLTVGELVKGIGMLDTGKRKDRLSRWLLSLEQEYADRIIPVDTETSRIWGEITAEAQKRGKIVSVPDGLIAATAIRHGLHVMTRNVSDFQETGAMLIDPLEQA